MRIAVFAWESKHSIAVGGMGQHISDLSATLASRGHEVHVFTRIAPQQPGYDWIDGVHYHRCPYEPHPDFVIDNERMCDSFVWHLAETESYLGGPFDVVHGHDWLAVRAMERAKHAHQRPLVLTIHSTEYGRCGNQLYEGMSRRIREIEWEGAYLSERVICVSGALRREVRDLYGVPGDKMHVVYNGVDVRRFDARVDTQLMRRKIDVGAADPFILFAGRMTLQKGPDLLMEAAPRLLKEHPSTKIVFAGAGDMRVGLERRAAALGVAPAVRFLGHRSGRELVGLFKSADVVCVPSRNEPFGIVILEAWSARKPVVVTRQGGPAEFVDHEHTGVTVTDDRDAIGAGVRTVLSDRRYAERLGRNGRKEAETRFSWDTVAAATEQIYLSAIQCKYQPQSLVNERMREETTMAKERTESVVRKTKTTPKTAKTPAAKTTQAKKTATVREKVAGSGETSRGRMASVAPSTDKAVTRSKPAAGVVPTAKSSDNDIRERAYQIYRARGGVPGDPVADWLLAEQQLRTRAPMQPRKKRSATGKR